MEEIYRLQMLSPLHLGERGTGMEGSGETIPSDTLFSALCWALREVEGDGWLQEWLGAFQHGPAPLLLTSAFPWVGDVRFYPRPMLRLPETLISLPWGDPSLSAGKRLKKIAYVSEVLFRQWMAGSKSGDAATGARLLPGGLWVSDEEMGATRIAPGDRWAELVQLPRVALDRASSTSSLYQVGEVRFREGCGLWFAVRWREEGWREPLEAALSCLGEAGIGGERSSGRGQFKWKRMPATGLEPPEPTAGRAVTLSLYHPTRQEVAAGLLDEAAYQLRLRRGWVVSSAGQGRRSRSVRMLAEGSAIGVSLEAGDLVDVTPDGFTAHPVYRYGLAFPVAAEVRSDG